MTLTIFTLNGYTYQSINERYFKTLEGALIDTKADLITEAEFLKARAIAKRTNTRALPVYGKRFR